MGDAPRGGDLDAEHHEGSGGASVLAGPADRHVFFDRHFAHSLVVANVQHIKQFYEFCRANS